MLEFLKEHQLNIMLCMSSICGIMAFFVLVTRTLSRRRKWALFLVELFAMLLLLFDRYAYIFRGDVSTLGFWMVRISNFMVYIMSVAVLGAFNMYLTDLFMNEGGLTSVPRRLRFAEGIAAVGALMIIFSQFTGFYYTFDEMNRYQRAPGFLVCYVVPMLILIIQLSVTVQYCRRIRSGVLLSLLLFTIVPLIASAIQIKIYGLSLTNISIVGMAVLLYIFALLDMNETVERANRIEVEYLKEEEKSMHRLFDQTATALASVIDKKDSFMSGHSSRTAGYARKIAEISGKSERECDEVYYAALLHDVGKIGIPDSVFGKGEDMTEEEHRIMDEHTVIGREILSSISEFPYLSVGASYHHERWDGTGFPEHLRGEAIPDIARIVAVADAYDTMSSRTRSREAMPQQKVREELIKGIGTRFDPAYVKVMVDLIDKDTDYRMRENRDVKEFVQSVELTDDLEMDCGDYKSRVTEGILLSTKKTRVTLKSRAERGFDEKISIPSIILFDSFDGCVHSDARKIEDLRYLEYGEIWFDGHTVYTAARNMRTETVPRAAEEQGEEGVYVVEAERFGDHARIRVTGPQSSMETVVALADTARFAYLSLTGEHCHISDIRVEETEETIGEGDIPRIAEEISYLDRTEGDIPNVQVDGYRSAATIGTSVIDGMRISFHTRSLPTAHLVWHCPYLVLYTSDDKLVFGRNYLELALIRLDGEGQASTESVEIKHTVNHDESFGGWDAWKEKNQAGYDVELSFKRRGNRITVMTENCGVAFRSVVKVNGEVGNIYAALTGDQCALTDIRKHE